MDSSTRVPGYDLFKLIVAIFLLILFLILMWMLPPQSFAPTSILLSPTGTMPASRQPTLSPAPSAPLPRTQVPGSVDQTQGETATAASTSLPLTVTADSIPSPTGTNASEPTITPFPSPTETPLVEPTATPVAGTTACEAATSRSHLQAGVNATILRRLNFRSSPGIRDNWLLTNIPGTQVEVVGGPECVPYWTGAYLWWQVKLPDGRIGWSAEGSLHGSFYFMEPYP